jgi:hypothetical protein
MAMGGTCGGRGRRINELSISDTTAESCIFDCDQSRSMRTGVCARDRANSAIMKAHAASHIIPEVSTRVRKATLAAWFGRLGSTCTHPFLVQQRHGRQHVMNATHAFLCGRIDLADTGDHAETHGEPHRHGIIYSCLLECLRFNADQSLQLCGPLSVLEVRRKGTALMFLTLSLQLHSRN